MLNFGNRIRPKQIIVSDLLGDVKGVRAKPWDTEYRSYPPGAAARVREDTGGRTAEVLSSEAGPGGGSEATAARLRFAQQHGIKPAALAFTTTPKTVRKWVRRWQAQGYAGLQELSRAPHQPARRISSAQRRRALELKRLLPSWGAARLKRDYQLPLSEKALRRIWRQEGLLRRKRRKHLVKCDLRAVKAAWRLFEQIDLDTKDLDDIPPLWPQIRRLGLPLIQYTAREVVSGLHFLGYAQERSLACSTLFARLLLHHLARLRGESGRLPLPDR